MKFLNYLNEKKFTVPDIIDILDKDCKPYLKQLTKKNFQYGELLMSGRKSYTNFGVKNIRKDRNPLDTPWDIHEWVDEQFYEKFGIKARSQTLFCSSNFDNTEFYGDSHYIFPIGNFEIIWSKVYEDLYIRLYMNKGLYVFKEFFLDKALNTYVKGNLKKALESGNEIMVYCKSFRYYLIAVKSDIGKSVINHYKETL